MVYYLCIKEAYSMPKVDKKRIGLRIDIELYDKLELYAKSMSMSVTQVILFLIANGLYTQELAKEIMKDNSIKLLNDKVQEK